MKPRRVTEVRAVKARREHPLEWLAESVAMEPTWRRNLKADEGLAEMAQQT